MTDQDHPVDPPLKETVTPKPCFLVSQPRSGSTLLQRLLANHAQIATSSEPWLLFPFVYALNDGGVKAEFDYHSMATGITEFVAGLPNGEHDYWQTISSGIRRLYSLYSGGNVTYFVDKTPRYYLFLDTLATMFPDAKFIILTRNPLAVAASILKTWAGSRFRLKGGAIDVYEAPKMIAQFLASQGNKAISIRYEDLVADPRRELDRITCQLGLDTLDEVKLDPHSDIINATLGDRTGPVTYSTVSMDSVDQWINEFASPVRRGWAKRYINHLGPESLVTLGYDPEDLLKTVDRRQLSARQCLTDIIDFHWTAIPNLLASRVQFSRTSKTRATRRTYRWSP